jgi:predicted DNA-binding transcriptional regulator YafY
LPRNDQIVRILSVARALAASRRGVSLKALAEREGWNWRTVYRDREALQAAGFPVEETSPGRYKLADGWAVPNLPGVEPDEIAAFFALRALVESWRTTALGKPLDRLWMKLASARGRQGALVPPREAWFTVRSPLSIDYRAHARIIATFERAVREHAVVGCRYTALSTGATTSREIEPGELYWDPGLESLYVIGWCRLRGAVRVFAVHRFLAATLTGDKFAPRGEARSAAALKHAFRVWRGDNVEIVRVRFSRAAAQEIRERTWRPRQRVEEEPGGTVVLALEVSGTAEVARWVMGFGGEAEVLAPAELRREVEARLRAGAALYEGERGRRAAEGGEEVLAWDDKGVG